ncbi:hypothetical protein ASD16_11985 [Cellulomonas sp. Root485]|uniref:protein kinase domain-containing protein n=1 Tax=Cellulomonas sp. Root485 TaxID=1736546 RepID=UPI0006FCE7C3|nr:serine/threonine-protein kinase [Cellulomonas sp. Root485]KQY23268.1 hypothetical protein ASD16_11985 [Cellulomonas sp. Root485]
MSEKLKLQKKTWEVRGPLAGADRAGFGRMFEVFDESGTDAVAKLVPQQPGADRELLFGDLPSDAQNVVPILDKGEHEDFLVLVMPRAEMSLQQRLRDDPPDLAEVIDILEDIARALASLDGQIVHRDLKPANVLLLGGRWCLADFGISKYADASTAADTRKFSWTPQYAAPEQWTFETATSKTDIYALGVTAYQLVSGGLPFTGTFEELRDAHLHDVPSPVGPTRLRAIIEECLYKAPGSRPAAANVLARLAQASAEPSLPGASALARVSETVRAEMATAFAQQRASESEADRRGRLMAVAVQSHGSLIEPLLTEVMEGVGNAGEVQHRPRAEELFKATLAGAKLVATSPQAASEWSGPFEVIATAALTVHRQQQSRGWLGRSHSLWYCDAQVSGEFSWYELAFMSSAFGVQPTVVPYSLDPQSAGIAFSNVTGTEQLAWPVAKIDRDDPREFVDRWIGWLASAAAGSLQMPSQLPERDTSSSWRRS